MSDPRPMIPAEAVEAAAEYLPYSDDCEVRPERYCTCWQPRINIMRAALEAAAPHMREDKRGDGDYRPGWDDRKTLSSLWQEHAPLPHEGLSERVHEALIAVATWGYQQRKDEEL